MQLDTLKVKKPDPLKGSNSRMKHSQNTSFGLRTIAFAMLIFGLVCVAEAQRAVRIDSVGVLDTRIPIAVPPFQTEPNVSAYSRTLSDTMAYDLEFTGLFNLVGEDQYPPDFRGFSGDATKIGFQGWRATPAEHLIYASVSMPREDLVVECRLFDVEVSQQVIGKRLQTKERWSRLLAHQFADETARYLTGVAGIASSEICFSAGELGNKEIYVADYDGASVARITGHNSISIKPEFSPDGRMVAYLSYKDHFPFVYIYDRGTGASRALSKRIGLNHAPAWAPNGRTLALCLSKDGNTEIYLKNADGTGERRVTSNRASDTSPAFSPDGRYIVFVSDRSGRPQIFAMTNRGAGVRRLSYQGGSSYDPAWSPDGQRIAYAVDKPGDGLEIYVMDADGRNSQRMTQSVGANESPSWSPDSRHIIFSSSRRGGSGQLYTVTMETGVVRRVPNLTHLSCEGPSWGPRRP